MAARHDPVAWRPQFAVSRVIGNLAHVGTAGGMSGQPATVVYPTLILLLCWQRGCAAGDVGVAPTYLSAIMALGAQAKSLRTPHIQAFFGSPMATTWC